MKEKISEILGVTYTSELEFKKMYGFTFVFKKKFLTMNPGIASGEIKPVGIIYDENGEYYFAPLDDTVPVESVVKEYVKKM